MIWEWRRAGDAQTFVERTAVRGHYALIYTAYGNIIGAGLPSTWEHITMGPRELFLAALSRPT